MAAKRTGLVMLLAVFVGVLSTGQVARAAQQTSELEEDLRDVFEDLAERLRDMGLKWQRSLVLTTSSENKRALITFMLRHSDQLGLSQDQIKGLKKLRSRFERKAIKWDADLRVAQLELDEMLEAWTVDMEKVEKKVREMERLRADRTVSRIRTIEEGKALLTPEQRKKLAAMLPALKERGDIN